MPTLSEWFRAEVESYLARTGTKPTEFGRLAAGDPSFVLSLRRGRSPTLATVDKVIAFTRCDAPGASCEAFGEVVRETGVAAT